MAVLATLKKDRLGEWGSLAEYLADLKRRETNSVAALAVLLSAPPDEQRELAAGKGLAVLVEVAGDLRLPKGPRLAAARSSVEAGVSGEALAALFVGAGDLLTDPRLGAAAKKLVEAGLPAALGLGRAAEVSSEAGAFARAVHAAASAVGQARVNELVASAPKGHAGVAAALFSLGTAELPPADREKWAKLLQQLCVASRSAPAAAKRIGLAPPWPPNVPDAFAPLVEEAEKASAHVQAPDAAAAPVRTSTHVPGRASARMGPPLRSGPALPGEKNGPAPAAAESSTPRPGVVEVGKKIAPPIKPSLFRRARGTLVEGPVKLPPKPMPEVAGRAPPEPVAVAPVLPSVPDVKPVRRAAVAAGPFAQRLQALFDDRPEAVERLCAAVEARAAVHGLRQALEELGRELSLSRWNGRVAPRGQLDRLAAAARAEPEAWTAAALLLLDRWRIERP